MHVLHCSHLFPPESRGGTQTYVAALADAQSAKGHRVTVLAGSPDLGRGGTLGETMRGDIRVIRLYREPIGESFSADVGAPALEARVGTLLDDVAPDLLHLHHWNGLVWNLVALARERGIRTVVTLHDLYTTCGRFFRMPDARSFCATEVTFDDCGRCIAPDVGGMDPTHLAPVLAERFRRYQDELGQADAVLCVSAAQRDLLQGIPGFGEHGIEVLPIGIPGSYRPEPRRTEDGPHADPTRPLRLVNWGGLDPRKGVHVLVAALSRVANPDAFELDLHGGGLDSPYHAELVSLAGDRNVRFRGRYEDDDLLGFGRHYDLAVFPFLAFETYGLVVDEALRAGLPVLTSSHGAPPERLGGRGLTSPPGDTDALARQLDELEKNRARVRAMAQASAATGDFEGHLSDLEKVYLRLWPRD